MAKRINKADVESYLVDQFDDFTSSLNGSNQGKIKELREEGIRLFRELGLPDKKDEEWKYTNLNLILKSQFEPVSRAVFNLSRPELEKRANLDIDSYHIVIENGFLNESLSDIPSEKGIKVQSLKSAIAENPEILEKHLDRYNFKKNGFSALNSAYLNDGVFIEVDKNAVIDKPVFLHYLNTSDENSRLIQTRNLFVIGESADVSVFEDYSSQGNAQDFLNILSEINLSQNSRLKHYRLQDDGNEAIQVSNINVHQERDSQYDNGVITLAGGFIRNDLNIAVEGENCESNLYGLYQINGKQLVDNHTVVDHKVPNCESNELYKGVLDGQAVGTFNGKVFVREDAQKINAFQSNRNILLDDRATVNTKPQLEIWADDVKCSHGATSGQLNEDELFYLQARGISKESAKSLLVYAFASEVISHIKHEALRKVMTDRLAKRLKIEDLG